MASPFTNYPETFCLVPAYRDQCVYVRGERRDKRYTRTVYEWVNDGNDADHHGYVARIDGDLAEVEHWVDDCWYEDGWIICPTIKIVR